MAYYTYSAPSYGTADTLERQAIAATTSPTSITTRPSYVSGTADTMERQIQMKQVNDLLKNMGMDFSDLPSFYSPYTWGGTTGGGGGGGGTYWQNRRDAAAGARASLDYLNRLIRANQGQYTSLVGNLEGAFAPRRQDVQSQYAAALAALQGRRTEAERLAGQGQAALGEYLARNLPRAYAGLPQATGPALSPDIVSTYAQAIGAPTGQIGEAAARAATESAGNVDAYNRLLGNLQAMESNVQGSRLAELEMLRNVQNAGIQQLYGGGATSLEQQRLAALNALANEQAQQRYIIDQQRIAREQALQQALAQVYGTGYVPFNPVDFFSTGVF